MATMASPSLKAGASAVSRSLLARAASAQTAYLRYSSTSTASSSSSSSASSSTSSPYTPTPNALPALSALTSPAGVKPPSRLKPVTDTFYTARPSYISLLIELEDLANKARRALERLHVLEANSKTPSYEDMLKYEEQLRHVRGPSAKVSLFAASVGGATRRSPWLDRVDTQGILGIPLKTAQYRNIISGLNTLSRYSALVHLHLRPDAAWYDLALQVEQTIDRFARSLNEGEGMGDGFTSKTGVDELGRVWAIGKRKESTAMVYIAPAKAQRGGALGEVQVNASSLSSYFTRQVHREQIVHPLRLTGLLGQFNVFALVQGGGHSGQAGAAAHGLAKAIVRFFQEKYQAADAVQEESPESQKWKTLSESVREVLLRDGVFKRDPRMVERKKTGLAKARKAYTWVKR